MTTKSKKNQKAIIQQGDVLHMWTSASYLNRKETRELEEVRVVKANSASVYIQRANSELEYRFDKKTMQCRDGFGGYYELFVDPNEFYDRWDRKQEILRLRSEIKMLTDSASLDILQQVHAIYTGQKQ